MKTQRLLIVAIVATVISLISCERESLQRNDVVATVSEQTVADKKDDPGPCNPEAYIVMLESRTLVDGTWEWIWSVQNPNPGNGSNGTSQDLSHWGFQLPMCVEWASVIGAGYSADGVNWTNFTPVYQSENSQNCLTTPVLKFDFGTTGTAKSYYRIIVNQEYNAAAAFGYYKSGSRCCTFNFTGIGCGGPVEVEVAERLNQ